MFGHVDVLKSDARGADGGAYHGLGRSDEGVNGAIGRRTGVHVQQTDAVDASDGVCYGINYLPHTMRFMPINLKILEKSTFKCNTCSNNNEF